YKYGADTSPAPIDLSLSSSAAVLPGTSAFDPTGVGSVYDAYNPSGLVAGWSFQGTAGLTANQRDLTAANPNVTEGALAAFLQGDGNAVIRYNLATTLPTATDTPGTTTYVFALSFLAAQRGSGNVANESVEIKFGDEVIGSFTPTSTDYEGF